MDSVLDSIDSSFNPCFDMESRIEIDAAKVEYLYQMNHSICFTDR
jgi:hypothetical protein